MPSRVGATTALFAAHALFMWMFVASAGLERAADAGLVTGSPGARDLAYGFASDWRHGMTGASPLYMAGFFATAAATWFAAHGRSLRSLVVGGASVATAATLVAWLFGRAGTALVVEQFERATGLVHAAPPLAAGSDGIAAGLYTLLTWSVFVIAGQRALASRSLRPFLASAALTVGLGLVRPMTADDFVALWAARVAEGDVTSLVSLAMIPVLVALFVWHHLRGARA